MRENLQERHPGAYQPPESSFETSSSSDPEIHLPVTLPDEAALPSESVEIVDMTELENQRKANRRQAVREANQRWREHNPEAYHAAQRRWREKDPEKTRETARRNTRAYRERKKQQSIVPEQHELTGE